MAELAAIANIFSVFGLADILFRHGKDLYDAITKFDKASARIPSLLVQLRGLESAIAQVLLLADQYKDSQFAQEPHQQATLADIEALLQDCKQDFEQLDQIIQKAIDCQSSGFLLSSRFRFSRALDEQTLVRFSQSLESHKTGLLVLLGTLGGHNHLVLGRELQRVQDDIAKSHSLLLEKAQNTDSKIAQLSNQCIDDFTSVKTEISAGIASAHTLLQENIIPELGNVQEAIKTRASDLQSRFDASTFAASAHHSAVETAISQLSSRIDHQLSELRNDLTRGTTSDNSIVSLLSKADDAKLATLATVSNQANSTSCNGPSSFVHSEAITLSFLLMKAQVLAAQKLFRGFGHGGSKLEGALIVDELDKFLSTCFRASASLVETRARARIDASIGPPDQESKDHTATTPNRHMRVSFDSKAVQMPSSDSIQCWDEIRYSWRWFSKTGVLIMRANKSFGEHDSLELNNENPILIIQLIFCPEMGVSDQGITATFTWNWSQSGSTGIYRSFKAYGIKLLTTNIINVIAADDSAAIAALIESGELSPSDHDHTGCSLLSTAAYYQSVKVFELLLKSGASIDESSEGSDLLYHIWSTPGIDNAQRRRSAITFTNLILAHNPNFRYPAHINPCPLHLVGLWSSLEDSETSEVVDVLLRAGCGLESRNSKGNTTLLAALALVGIHPTRGIDLVGLFLDRGADCRVWNDDGCSALHVLFENFQKSRHMWSEAIASNVVEIILMLLRAGCDPNALNDYGKSPTDILIEGKSAALLYIWEECIRAAGYATINIETDLVDVVPVILADMTCQSGSATHVTGIHELEDSYSQPNSSADFVRYDDILAIQFGQISKQESRTETAYSLKQIATTHRR